MLILKTIIAIIDVFLLLAVAKNCKTILRIFFSICTIVPLILLFITDFDVFFISPLALIMFLILAGWGNEAWNDIIYAIGIFGIVACFISSTWIYVDNIDRNVELEILSYSYDVDNVENSSLLTSKQADGITTVQLLSEKELDDYIILQTIITKTFFENKNKTPSTRWFETIKTDYVLYEPKSNAAQVFEFKSE